MPRGIPGSGPKGKKAAKKVSRANDPAPEPVEKPQAVRSGLAEESSPAPPADPVPEQRDEQAPPAPKPETAPEPKPAPKPAEPQAAIDPMFRHIAGEIFVELIKLQGLKAKLRGQTNEEHIAKMADRAIGITKILTRRLEKA